MYIAQHEAMERVQGFALRLRYPCRSCRCPNFHLRPRVSTSPRSTPTPVSPGALPGVSFWPRVAARVIDWVSHYVIGLFAGFLFGFLYALAAALHHSRPAPLFQQRGIGIALFVFSLLGLTVLEIICEGFHGSTLGKRLLGFVVVQEDGSPCRPGPALIRSLAYIIDALFFGLIGYFNMQKNPQQQRHGDEWAHTIVCRRSDVAPHNLRGAGHFTAVFLLAAMADAALMIIGVLIKLSA